MDNSWLILVAYGDAVGVPPRNWSRRSITLSDAANKVRRAVAHRRLVHLVKMDHVPGSSGLRQRIVSEMGVELPSGTWGITPRFTETHVHYIRHEKPTVEDVSIIEVRGKESELCCFEFTKTP